MPAFRYQALDPNGKNVEGVIESDTPRQARQVLREQGKLPLAVDVVDDDRERTSQAWAPAFRRGIPSAELALLTRQLATLLAAGLTVEQALTALVDQSEAPRIREILAGVRAEVRAGHSLSSALQRFERSFAPLYRNVIAAGEQSGDLGTVMLGLADYIESREQLKQRVILALIYPALVTAVALAVVIGLMTYVVPQVVTVFQNSRQSLPLLTQLLLLASAATRASIWIVLVLGVAGAIVGMRLWQRESVRERVHRWLLTLPLAGSLIRGVNTARFASTLAILSSSGVPILVAFRAGASVVSSLPMRRAVDEAASLLREGASLSRALRESGQFPPMLIHLVSSGEATGRLPETLRAAARQQELEVTARVSAITTILEPALILAMGAFVLLIVLAILQPIIEMNQLVR